ncbi:hypothetical protein Fot_14827 [Forsythia ovata]|uniref:Uncharacterized protein n=1 Tax=Forsythia ovata TaxID=205694 RepID=A0ABD1W7F3_9LAMI
MVSECHNINTQESLPEVSTRYDNDSQSKATIGLLLQPITVNRPRSRNSSSVDRLLYRQVRTYRSIAKSMPVYLKNDNHDPLRPDKLKLYPLRHHIHKLKIYDACE